MLRIMHYVWLCARTALAMKGFRDEELTENAQMIIF